MYSPLKTPFLFVGGNPEVQFVRDVPIPTPSVFSTVKEAATAIVEDWIRRKCVLLTDFEGENMGWGGDLTCAQFLPTSTVDGETKEFVHSDSSWSSDTINETGLLVHSKCEFGKQLIKRVMESSACTKLIWGADADLASLRHQIDLPNINSKRVIDVQLCFSEKTRRLGMGKMIENVRCVRPREVAMLPNKEREEYYFLPSTRNMQSTELPYTKEFVYYAMCDLHRIELILRTAHQDLLHSLEEVAEMTAEDIRRLDEAGAEVCCEFLRTESPYYENKWGLRRMEKTIQFARSVKHCRVACADQMTEDIDATLTEIEQLVAPDLEKLNVVVPNDLSFADRDTDFLQAEIIRLEEEKRQRFSYGSQVFRGGRADGVLDGLHYALPGSSQVYCTHRHSTA
ncbi:hypothetical protein TrVE_jg4262 [Triparma verrucosa]|uniref:Uncharacterized protein n=1 Tax=Triparma verrucosa TaxID=1606542 RepID=A0A9W7FJ56_9STRA|nr:hypothetical protein TrVE_jg4262 [Triparma verrucosa]